MKQSLLEEFIRLFNNYEGSRRRWGDDSEIPDVGSMAKWVRENSDSINCENMEELFDGFIAMAAKVSTGCLDGDSSWSDRGKGAKGCSLEDWEVSMPGLSHFREFCRRSASIAKGIIPSGFGSLDSLVGGFRSGELTVIGARPGVGESAFLQNIVRNVALKWYAESKATVPVGFFSTDWTSFELSAKIIEVAGSKGFEGSDESQWNVSSDFLKYTDFSQIYIIDALAHISVPNFFSLAERLVREKGVRLIAVDNMMQIRDPAGSGGNGLAAVVKCLKTTARKLNVPIVALSGTVWAGSGEALWQRFKYAPRAIEKYADVIMLMEARQCEVWGWDNRFVNVLKNTGGPTGEVRFIFDWRNRNFSQKYHI